MEAAAYRARIKRLRLSAGDAARLCRVADRTHRSWVSEERAIPDGVERILDQYEASLAAERLLRLLRGAPAAIRLASERRFDAVLALIDKALRL